MRHLMRLAVIGLALTTVVGCTQFRQFEDRVSSTWQAVTTAKVSPKAVVLAVDAFRTVEISGTNYLRLHRCSTTSGPICRDPAMTPVIDGALHAGINARDNLKTFLRQHPGKLGPQGDYDALVTATDTIRTSIATYIAATTKR